MHRNSKHAKPQKKKKKDSPHQNKIIESLISMNQMLLLPAARVGEATNKEKKKQAHGTGRQRLVFA
jgi:hypothetical protein